jgi:hypothetical protein
MLAAIIQQRQHWMKITIRHGFNSSLPGCLALLLQLIALPGTSAADDLFGELTVSISQRYDNLNWNIAGTTVNVLSELKWENISITQLQTAAEIHLGKDRMLRPRLGIGAINSGSNSDSDYNGSNRTQEFSRSFSKAGGDVLDGSIGLGKRLRMQEPSGWKGLYVTPLVGISIHRQNLTMTDGVQTISSSPSTIPLGPFPGLASSYDANWIGPWLGAEAMIETDRGWLVKANVEYHLIDYSASANWNLRADLAHPVSFRHSATGEGILISLGASYPAGKNWKAGFTLESSNWSTVAGSDQVYFTDGTIGQMRLNAVNWNSTAFHIGIVREF